MLHGDEERNFLDESTAYRNVVTHHCGRGHRRTRTNIFMDESTVSKEGCNESLFLQEDEDEDFMDESTVNKEGCNASVCRRTRKKASWTSPL
jgi:hypothetical protein